MSNNTRFVSTRHNNTHYAPGLSLYGIDGRDGLSGTDGASLFICIYDITDVDDRGRFGNAVRHGNTMTMGETRPLGRDYVAGDSFLFPDGKIYSIRRGPDDDPSYYLDIIVSAGDQLSQDQIDECMSYDGRITIENQSSRFTPENNRLVLNTTDSTGYKGFVINNSGADYDFDDIEAPLTVIGSQKTAVNGIERYIDIKSIQTGVSDAQFRIYYDANNGTYVIDSDRPIRIDADLTVERNSTSVAGYSGISTTDTPITSFKGVCENTHYTAGEPEVIYEYYTDKKTCQVYEREKDTENDLRRITDGPERTDTSDNEYTDTQGVTFLRYSRDFSYINDNVLTYRACKKISVHIFRNPAEDENIDGIPIFIQFTNRNSEGNEQVMDAPPVVLMDAAGNRNESLTHEIEDIPAGRLYWKTESVYVPSEADNFVIVMPAGMEAYVMVFGEGAPAHVIDETVEKKNYDALKDLFSGDDVEVSKNRFPIDVLRTATAHYYRTFDITFNPDAKQIVPKEVLPTAVHIRGLLNGCVDIEFYNELPHSDEDTDGFVANVEIDSYCDITTIDEWRLSLVGISEIEIREEE